MPAVNTTIEALGIVSRAAEGSTDVLHVVCAWPVSGQYGPGSRVLYYVLIATCLMARRVGWIVNACIAVALLFPAVAALHGIVLAAVHVDGAVDMDVFGAFQLCSIGIVAAPVTVMLSKTFFNEPGRNIIFLWALLILVGLISLAIEFYRTQTIPCPYTDAHKTTKVSPYRADFPYDDKVTCGLICSPELGPKSPMRGGAGDNVYVIPAPSVLTFGTATLLAAACSLHAILCLVSMLHKVLKVNWKKHFSSDEDGKPDEMIEGANGATKENLRNINSTIRHFLSMVAIPVFGGAGVALMIAGEVNFFSKEVNYQTEPMASVGQWAPIVGTGLGLVGSLYLLLEHDVEVVQEEENHSEAECHCNHRRSWSRPSRGRQLTGNRDTSSESHRRSASSEHAGEIEEVEDAQGNANQEEMPARRESNAGRHKVARFLNRMGDALGSPPKSFVRDESRQDDAFTFPIVPAEPWRHQSLQATMDTYEVMVTHSHSRPGSIRDSSPSTSRTSRSRSPHPRSNTLPSNGFSSYSNRHFSSTRAVLSPQSEDGSLAIPSPVHHLPETLSPFASPPTTRSKRRFTSPTRISTFSPPQEVNEVQSPDAISLRSLSPKGSPSPKRSLSPKSVASRHEKPDIRDNDV